VYIKLLVKLKSNATGQRGSGSGQRPVAGACERGDELSGSIKGAEMSLSRLLLAPQVTLLTVQAAHSFVPRLLQVFYGLQHNSYGWNGVGKQTSRFS
jgi:hypothetical protein